VSFDHYQGEYIDITIGVTLGISTMAGEQGFEP